MVSKQNKTQGFVLDQACWVIVAWLSLLKDPLLICTLRALPTVRLLRTKHSTYEGFTAVPIMQKLLITVMTFPISQGGALSLESVVTSVASLVDG